MAGAFTTTFMRLVGIDLPIVLAPLAGGPSTPALAGAVTNAGGLGSLGAGYLPADQISAQIAAVRASTDGPFAANLFVEDTPDVASDQVSSAWARVAPYRHEVGLGDEPPPTRFAEPFAEQLQAVLDGRVPVVSFTFGLPAPAVIDAVHASGALVVLTATSEAEGAAAVAAGADAICAQGTEAGGHRGTFIGDAADSLIGTMALVPRLVDTTGLPVLAAGGIMDGRGVAAALVLGAGAAQLGTAFLRCPEAGTSEPYREALAEADGSTMLVTGISGRAARGLPNRLSRELTAAPGIPAYPVMNALTRELRRRAAEMGRSDLLSLWAGQGVRGGRELPAADLVAQLMDETVEALGQFGRPGGDRS